MKKSILFFIIFSLINNICTGVVTSSKSSYIINDITVEEFGDNLKIVRESALTTAKRKAFLELKFHINKLDLNFTDLQIDSCISNFIINNEELNKNQYTLSISIKFNKSLLNKIIAENSDSGQELEKKRNITCKVIAEKNARLDDKFIDLIKFLIVNKITYTIDSIGQDSVMITLFDINTKTLMESKLLKNNSKIINKDDQYVIIY